MGTHVPDAEKRRRSSFQDSEYVDLSDGTSTSTASSATPQPWQKFVAEEGEHQQACYYQPATGVTLMADDFMDLPEFEAGEYVEAKVCPRGRTAKKNCWQTHEDDYYWTKTIKGSVYRVDLPDMMKQSLAKAKGRD